MSPFLQLPVDLKFLIISHLLPKDILILRQTCKELEKLSRDRSVWISQCENHILSKGYPFSTPASLDSLSVPELERQIYLCDRVSQKWAGLARGRPTYPRDGTRFAPCHVVRSFDTGAGMEIRSADFINAYGRSLVLVHYKDDWSVLEVWDLAGDGDIIKVSEWRPMGTIIKYVAVNRDPESSTTIAIGMMVQPENHLVQILSLTPSLSFEAMATIQTGMNPIAFQGDLVGLGDHVSQTLVWNWKAAAFTWLKEDLAPEREGHTTYSPGAEEDETGFMNPVINIFFFQDTVFVARAYTLSLFCVPKRPRPTLGAVAEGSIGFLAKHSFGCIDAICMTPAQSLDGVTPTSYHILVRGFSDDAWRDRDSHTLQLYALDATASPTAPYLFPPRLQAQMPTKYGRVTCRNVYLGKAGVALWVQPKQFRAGYQEEYGMDHYVDSPHIRLSGGGDTQKIHAAILPGSPYRLDGGVGSSSTGFVEELPENMVQLDPILLKTNHGGESDWTCMDWDEAGGRIVVGLQDGWVTFIEM